MRNSPETTRFAFCHLENFTGDTPEQVGRKQDFAARQLRPFSGPQFFFQPLVQCHKCAGFRLDILQFQDSCVHTKTNTLGIRKKSIKIKIKIYFERLKKKKKPSTESGMNRVRRLYVIRRYDFHFFRYVISRPFRFRYNRIVENNFD